MSDSIFHIFSNELFLDLTVYQYGYEKCDPLHSYGPFVRNHYLFHYIISGKGMLSVTEKDDSAVYHMEAHSGFLIEPGRINLYSADQKFPWEYVWVEFSYILLLMPLSRVLPIKKDFRAESFQDFTHRKHFLLLNKVIHCQSQSKIWQIAVILTEAILVKFSKI